MTRYAAADVRARIVGACEDLRSLEVPMRVLAPVLAAVDPAICENCGRVTATDEDWAHGYDGGDGDWLCWGTGANCELDHDFWPYDVR